LAAGEYEAWRVPARGLWQPAGPRGPIAPPVPGAFLPGQHAQDLQEFSARVGEVARLVDFAQGLLHIAMAAEIAAAGENPMKYLHTMVRVTDIEQSLRFYRDALGLKELSRRDFPQGRYTLVFLSAPGDESAQVELTHNWDPETYGSGRNFGHLAYGVENIYASCERLMQHGVTINRPPRDGRMAFVRSPDNVSIELLQQGAALPPAEPWTRMPNSGVW
jgi:lactoylglutathione lyase